MTKETLTRLGHQLTYALRGVLISACIWSIAFMVLSAIYVISLFDPETRMSSDTPYTFIGVTLLGFVGLSLVLALNGWRKGKRVAIRTSEQSGSENSSVNMSGTTVLLLFLAIVLVSLALRSVL